jgi:hypothetical protein
MRALVGKGRSVIEVTWSMNKAEIIAELENTVAARLFGRRPRLADRETVSALNRKLLQMSLLELVRLEPYTWRISRLGKEVDLELFAVFIGLMDQWEVPMILEQYGLMDEAEIDAICEMSNADAESVLSGYVKRACFDYHKARKFLH